MSTHSLLLRIIPPTAVFGSGTKNSFRPTYTLQGRFRFLSTANQIAKVVPWTFVVCNVLKEILSNINNLVSLLVFFCMLQNRFFRICIEYLMICHSNTNWSDGFASNSYSKNFTVYTFCFTTRNAFK